MERDRAEEEPRGLSPVPEADATDGKPGTSAQWLEAGAEDPAFFIKTADEDGGSSP